MKRLVISILICLFQIHCLHAEKGLWLPKLDTLHWYEIKELGFNLSMDELYSEDKPSLKDVVVRFGNGCSGVVVSERGLIMTNHHCALRYVENISTKEHDYLSEGYWAEGKREVPIDGLSVKFLQRMIDVTDSLHTDAFLTIPDKEIKHRIQEIEGQYTDKKNGYEANIVSLYSGNKYYLYQYQVFQDVRLVGIPPFSLGKWGKDKDNWMWARHTADFAIFRIYAGEDNLPASYSSDNIPYKPQRYAPISLNQLKEGDFTFVLGYPGATDQYKNSDVLSNLVHISYPEQIDLMKKYLTILDTYMIKDKTFELNNTSAYGSISNVMKRFQGFIAGIERTKKVELSRSTLFEYIAYLRNDLMLKICYDEYRKTYYYEDENVTSALGKLRCETCKDRMLCAETA
ncbi:S46 family peptidase [Massilibacteroides vaginae]|uniref:S46 family peptidase n=1 Tax=Massilibacteroides vaginae TaxID=1673718 RepID=UPI000A1CE39B|nr:S46 family peptidase [Massilibacteroides vaginae]